MPAIHTLDLALMDLRALRAVCRRHGWEFYAGQRRYRWFGRHLAHQPLPAGIAPEQLGRCDHAIAVPGCLYEIGLLDRGTHYLPLWDDDPDGGLDSALGERGSVLWQAYVSEVVRRAAARRWHIHSQLRDGRGTLRLRVLAPAAHAVAHLCVDADAAATLWDLDPTDRNLFRYLADALGRVRSTELLIPDTVAAAG